MLQEVLRATCRLHVRVLVSLKSTTGRTEYTEPERYFFSVISVASV
jgi:hypothetical protein